MLKNGCEILKKTEKNQLFLSRWYMKPMSIDKPIDREREEIYRMEKKPLN